MGRYFFGVAGVVAGGGVAAFASVLPGAVGVAAFVAASTGAKSNFFVCQM